MAHVQKKRPELLGAHMLTDRGRTVSEQLSGNLLPSVQDDSLANAWRLIDFGKRGIKCHAELDRREDGVPLLRCTMTEHGKELFTIAVAAESEERARRMKETFGHRPDVVWRGMLALLTGEPKFLFD